MYNNKEVIAFSSFLLFLKDGGGVLLLGELVEPSQMVTLIFEEIQTVLQDETK